MTRPDNLAQIETPATVLSVQVGRVAPLGPDGVPSAIVKRPVTGPVPVGFLGLEGDVQADLTVHGGRDKAVYAYATSAYTAWRSEFPEHRERLIRGAFGENLTVDGLDESGICAGDIHAIGSARLQVCQPRQPCFKLALRFEDARMPRAIVQSGRSGWYYRVLEDGEIRAGDRVTLVDRPHPNLPFERLIAIIYRGQVTETDLALVAEASGVADWLRTAAGRILTKRQAIGSASPR